MYFDNLTVISLIIFAIAFGSFIYACVIRGCMAKDAGHDSSERADSRHDDL